MLSLENVECHVVHDRGGLIPGHGCTGGGGERCFRDEGLHLALLDKIIVIKQNTCRLTKDAKCEPEEVVAHLQETTDGDGANNASERQTTQSNKSKSSSQSVRLTIDSRRPRHTHKRTYEYIVSH